MVTFYTERGKLVQNSDRAWNEFRARLIDGIGYLAMDFVGISPFEALDLVTEPST